MLHHVLHLLLGRRAGLLRATEDHLGELVLVDAHLVLVGQLVEDDLRLERGLGVLGDLRPELLLVLGGLVLVVLEVALQRVAGAGELVADLRLAALDLGGQHGLGQVEGGLGDQVGDHGVGGGVDLLDAGHAHDGLGQVGLHLVDGVELGHHLGELVVQLGQGLGLHLGDGDLDVGLLALGGAADQLGGELDVVAGLLAGDRVVQPVEHAAGADLVGQALGRAVLDLLAVDGGDQVDGDHVAGLGRTVLVGAGGEALAHDLDALVHLVIGGREGGHLGGQLVERRHLEVGAHVQLGGELDHVVVLELGDVHLGLAQGHQLVLADRGGVRVGQRGVDRLLQHRAAAEALVDDRCGHLPLAEARDVHLRGDVLVRLVEVGLEVGEGDLDGELDPGRAELLDGAGHLVDSCVWTTIRVEPSERMTGIEPA